LKYATIAFNGTIISTLKRYVTPVAFLFATVLPCVTAMAQTTESSKSLNPTSYRVLDRFDVGPDLVVRSLLADSTTNTLWVGTSSGVMEIDLETRKLRQTFTREQGLANEYVFAIGKDQQDHLWFGTNGGGASRYNNGQWDVYFPMHGLADYWVYAFAQQNNGDFWIGTWAGASKFDFASSIFTNFKDELVNEWVYGLDVDASDRVWFGTEGGVSMLDGESWHHWTHKDGLGAVNEQHLPASTNTGLGTRSRHDLNVLNQGQETYNPNYVFSLVIAEDDTVWAGTWGGGVGHFDGEDWTNYTQLDGLAGNIVFSLIQEPSGAFWFGTQRGLTRFHNNTWTSFKRDDGLINDSVYALAVVPNGDIWVGTRGGVVRIGATANNGE